jgi:hypothetical protein
MSMKKSIEANTKLNMKTKMHMSAKINTRNKNSNEALDPI